MFTISYGDKEDGWMQIPDVSLDDALQRLKAMGRDQHWFYVSSHEIYEGGQDLVECMISIAQATKGRYHIIYDDRRIASQWRCRAIDATRWKTSGTIQVRGNGWSKRCHIYETVEIDEAENALRQFFTQRQVRDTEKTVWKTIS